ncbi:hypothetical protein VTN31DRAFT_3074 [Thermomyces dupontii]|uniref:uncharacterized protein n=1 Tax=Talaromyces thermophilus TaxID=28565 RepID=UPI0037430429
MVRLTSAADCLRSLAVSSRLRGIPAVPFESKSEDVFSFSTIRDVAVDARYQHEVDRDGQTLIPPILHQFANTFVRDLQPVRSLSIQAVNCLAMASSLPLTVTERSSMQQVDRPPRDIPSMLRPTESSSKVPVPLGAWLGTRTVLQQTILNDGTIPLGSGRDVPGWGTRSIMLDVGRKYLSTNGAAPTLGGST